MLHIRFKYRDEFCKDGKWNEQECIVSSVAECKRIYGLDQCEHEILEVKEVKISFDGKTLTEFKVK